MNVLLPLILLASANASAPGGAKADAVLLSRVFKPNTKLSYAVRSALSAEFRGQGLTTWLPSDLDINYDFTISVEALKTDGIAVVRYRRPTVDEVEGETFDAPAKTNVLKVNFDDRMTLSPFNEILDTKDLAPKKKPSSDDSGDARSKFVVRPGFSVTQQSLDEFVGQFVGELYRLCLFAGPVDSSLDLAPKTPFNAVSVGDTWKRTVGYQPQKLKGKNGQQAVQRLDYLYTYKGVVDGDKGKVLRVEAKLDFSNDIAEFVHQITSASAEQTGLQKLPMTLTATILFDLDPKTHDTIKAEATSKATVQVFAPDHPADPVVEERMKGHTTLRLMGRTVIKPSAK